MRVLLTTLLFFLMLPKAYAAGNVQPLTTIATQQSEVAVKLFQKACLMSYGRAEKMEAMLDKHFPREQPEEAKAALKTVNIKTGTVWSVAFPQGSYEVVRDSSGNCHVLAGDVDSAALHADIKALAVTAFKDLANYTVDYQAVKSDDVRAASGFNLNGFGDDPLLIVKAYTLNNPSPDQPAAIISMSPVNG